MRRLLNSLLAVVLLIIVLLANYQAFAWFSGIYRIDTEITGASVGAYFESGSGTSTDPYIISEENHIANLSWLQANGRLDDSDTTTDGNQPYYFHLKKSITITAGLWIPPIGTKDHPFNGVFDGNSKIITDVKITTSTASNRLGDHEFAYTGVGLFGDITDKASVSSFTLVNPYVENDKTISYIGIICGNALGSIKNVGVYKARISSINQMVASNYALLGNVGDNVIWNDQPGDEKGGDLIINGNSLTQDISTGSYQMVQENVYFTGEMKAALKDRNFYLGYTVTKNQASDSFTASQTVTLVTPNGNNFDSALTNFEYLKEKTELMYVNNGSSSISASLTGLRPRKYPVDSKWDIGTNYVSADGVNLPIASIWFKPYTYGRCHIILSGQEKGYNALSLFKFSRSNDALNIIEETVFYFNTGSVYGHSYFYYDISSDDIKNKYEFAFAAPSGSTGSDKIANFGYLKLAGTSDTGGSEDSIIIDNVDFVKTESTIIDDNYDADSGVAFKIEITTASSVILYFRRDEDIVKYYPSSGVTVVGSGTSSNTDISADFTKYDPPN